MGEPGTAIKQRTDSDLQDSVTGLLLAGIGVSNHFLPPEDKMKTDGPLVQHVTPAPDSQKNFLVVDGKTDNATIESAFDRFTERKDIGIVLINQHVRSS